MFHKFKITSCAFILCLFGLTLMTVSPVFAEDSPEFIACQQMKGKMAKKNCFRDLARLLAGDSPEFIACQQMKWKGGKKEKKNCFRDLARAEQAAQAELANPATKCELKSSGECAEVFCSKFPEISGTNAGCQAGYINGWFCGVDNCLSGAKCEMESYECAPVFCSKFPEGKGLGANPGCQAGYIKGWYRETK